MSIIPLLLNLAEEVVEPNYWDLDDDFPIHPQQLCRINYRPTNRLKLLSKYRKSPYSLRKVNRGKDELLPHVGKDGFEVTMDVQQFKPEEITVKTVDNTVVVEGKHEEREDGHGLVSRHFVRKYTLPKHFNPKDVASTLSSDGVLTVKAPLPPEKKAKAKEHLVPVQQTGIAHNSIKDSTDREVNANAVNGAADK